jgi:hypothetical protein
MKIFKTIEEEIFSYQTEEVFLSENCSFSQYNLVRRLSLYDNQVYPKGKLDSQDNYKYWFDIITPNVNNEIKNIDFDRSNISVYSNSIKDSLAVYITNLQLNQWLIKTGQGEELNDSVEEFSSWGNVVWKKVKGGYERTDLKNFYVLNQTAKTLKDSAVLERHLLTQSDLREKEGVWKNIDEVIKNCSNKQFSSTTKSTPSNTSNPYYEIWERNGEVSEEELFEAMGETGGDPDKYVLAKIITAGLSRIKEGNRYVLYAKKIDKMPYKEAHRGRYKGRWLREGLLEVLFDCQMRANEIGNQIARGLEYASKTILKTADDSFVSNILTDLRNGDVLKSKDLSQVDVRMQGFDQLLADWNRNIETANKLSNSYEVVSGENLPSNTPFRLGALMNANANKLFDFIREKLALSFEDLVNDWILPDLLSELRGKTVIDLTNSEENLKDYYEMVANSWYIKNLISIGPHSPEVAEQIKSQMIERLTSDKKAIIEIEKGFWDGFKPRAKVDITGENVKLAAELESIFSFTQLEADPVRRSALIEMAMAKKNIDISNLPKTPPQQIQQQMQPNAVAAEQSNQASINRTPSKV